MSLFTLAPLDRSVVNTERDRRVNDGFVYNGKEFQTDMTSRENISGAHSLAIGALLAEQASGPKGLRWSDPDRDYAWTATDNDEVPMTAAACQAFCQAAMEYKEDIIKAARNLKDMPTIPEDYADDNHWPSRTLT